MSFKVPGIGQVLAAVRTSDATAVNNSTTFVTSTVLTVSLPANTTWRFDPVIFYDGSTAGDLKMGWSTPTGATGLWTPDSVNLATAGSLATILRAGLALTAAGSAGGMGTGTANTLEARPVGVVVVTTAGSFAFKYAQWAADATDLVIRAPSSLICTRIA